MDNNNNQTQLAYRFVTDLPDLAGQIGVGAELHGDVGHVLRVDVRPRVQAAVSLHQRVRPRAYPCNRTQQGPCL